MFNKPNWEAVKEVARWVLFFVISWVITETLKQADLVPEFQTFQVWVFTYTLPIRTALTFGLTMAGRYVDKYLFERSKAQKTFYDVTDKPKGLLPF